MTAKKFLLKFIMMLLLLVTCNYLFAQDSTKPVITHFAKYKPPVVKSYLGIYTGNDITVTVDEGKEIIGLPLTVKDSKNNIYPVISYDFAYKRMGYTEDEETGKMSIESDTIADHFTDVPLIPLWISTIKDTLKSGEQFHFLDIIVKDTKGHIFYAPDLRINMQ
jgi:hypothetical protein